MSIIICGPQTNEKYSFTIHTFKLKLESWMELYSQHYAQESLFIPILFRGITIQSRTIVENTDTPHNILTIHIGVNFFLFSKFSSHEGKIAEVHVKC